MIGPFIFLDRMGPARLDPGEGVDVRPHPHIGLATVTYLFEGELLHRDSVGSVQPIRPGDVNWMTAGRGIAHSERTPVERRPRGGRISGLQLWVALPRDHEESDPGFAHHAADTLPVLTDRGLQARIVAGSFLGVRSPVALQWDTLLADVTLRAGAVLPIPAQPDERALYVMSGAVEIDGQVLDAGPLYVLKPGIALAAKAMTAATVALIGGAPMDGPRHIWWNFVSSSEDRIEQARADWMAGRFGPVPGEVERVEAPDRPQPRVRA
jgi:redox-sensitive bicupin YhaK (pirin superfamily)